MKKKFTNKMTNAVEPAAPASVWGYKGCAGKGGATQNAVIINKTNVKETD
jgi:hypothetical protein